MRTPVFSLSGIRGTLSRCREIVLYLIVGVITTALNGAVYWLATAPLQMANVPGTVLAWVIAVLFAFFANKIWVFESRSMRPALVLKEMAQFMGCRLGTGILDVGIMYVSVDLWGWNGLLMKLISDFLVTLINFAMSKFFIFKPAERPKATTEKERENRNVSTSEDKIRSIHSFYIFAALPFSLIAAYFAWTIAGVAGFIFGDVRLLMQHIPAGSKWIIPLFWGGTSPIWIGCARFWPLYEQEYNILSLFAKFRVPENMAAGLYFINSVVWIVFSAAFFLFLSLLFRYSGANRARWYAWLALPLCLLCLLSQPRFSAYFLDLIFAEKMTILLLSIFGAAYYAAFKTNRGWMFTLAGGAALLATYYKETNFSFFVVIAGFWLLFGWKTLSRKHFCFLIFLLLNSCVFFILYYTLSYRLASGTYNSGRFHDFWPNVIVILRRNPVFLLALLLGCFRLFFVAIKRDVAHLWADSLLFASIAFFLSFFILKLFDDYYFIPANIFFLAVFFYWCLHIKWKYCFGIFPALLILLFSMFGSFTQEIKRLHLRARSDVECLQEISGLLRKSKKLHCVIVKRQFYAWKLACLQEFVWFFCGNWRKEGVESVTSKNVIVPIRIEEMPKHLAADEIYIMDRSMLSYSQFHPLYQNIKDVFASRGFVPYKSFESYEFFAKATPLSYPVDIWLNREESAVLSGFGGKESSGRWMNEKSAHVKIPLMIPANDLLFRLQGFPFLIEKFNQNEMTVFVNGTEVKRIKFSQGKAWDNSVIIPRNLIVNGTNDFEFRLKDLKSPSEFGYPDIRKLGFFFKTLYLEETLPLSYPVDIRLNREESAILSGFGGRESSGRWMNEKSAHVKIPLMIPENDLLFRVQGFPFLTEKFNRNEMAVFVNGTELKRIEFSLGKAWDNFVFIPRKLLVDGVNDFEFRLKDLKSPSEFGYPDIRKQGFHFREFHLEEASSGKNGDANNTDAWGIGGSIKILPSAVEYQ